jgi:UDP:flavonoid glycosyltransferase YjiC (YdhE family)
MRILFTFDGNRGHLDPLIPIARAAMAAGHAVAFAGRPWMVPKVELLGFACFAAGLDDGLIPQPAPLRPFDLAREVPWGSRKPRARIADLLPVLKQWRPDLVVWEETDIAGGIVAERLGLLHVSVVVSASGSFFRPEVVRSAVRELRAELGLPPDPHLEMLSRYLVLAPVPPSFRDPDFPLPRTGSPIQPAALDASRDDDLPAWIHDLPPRPTLYFTLGSVFPLESGDVFARVVAGVRELPVTLIVSVGDEFDPGDVGPQPPNVWVERWIPQVPLLSRCDIVICHGGSGTVIGALAHGLPLVVIPIGADQPANAARCEALGVGRVLDPIGATQDEARDAVQTVLSEPSYRESAGRLEREALALPGPREAVMLLERLAAERRPLVGQ